jgi:endonuclease/exonuclease/phosphatase (EEP) superfamily protein YafD
MIKKLFSWWADGPVAAGVLLAGGVVLAFAPDLFLTMLARAFLWQWALGFVVIALWNLHGRRWWTVSAAMSSAVITLWPPLATTQQAMVATNDAPMLRIAQMNVFQPNQDHDRVLSAALRSGADVISFQEVSPEWARVLEEGLRVTYPYHRTMSGMNCYGIALFSRIPFEEAAVRPLCSHPMVDAVVRTADGPVRVLSVHASSPGDYKSFRERNAQLEQLAQLINDSTLPTVLIGDLNTVSWDHAFRRLCRRADLREHSEGTTATWPSVAGMALIPLDHVLVSPELCVAQQSTFDIAGSDHRGLLASIAQRP